MGLNHQDFPVRHQFKDLKNLKRLNIGGAQVSDFALKILGENCWSLPEIGLGKCRGVADTGIMQLVSRCVDLKVLDLTCCSDLTDLAILAVASSCRDLTCLKLECCNLLSETSLECLGSKCALLEEIDLTDCSGINDKGKIYRNSWIFVLDFWIEVLNIMFNLINRVESS